MKIGIRIPECRPAPEVARYLTGVERAGFDFAGLLDSQLLARDLFVSAAMGLTQTSDLKLFTAVTNPLTRHVSVLAGAAMTVHEIAPGRFGIIMGSGYSSASTIGRKAATLQEMREAVDHLRRLFRREYVRFGDTESHLQFADGEGPKIYIAATGPRMIELAGEIGDGVLLAAGVHPAMVAGAMDLVRKGAAVAGRDPAEIDVILFARAVVHEDLDMARRFARPMCAQWVVDSYRAGWLEKAGLDLSIGEISPELRALYPDIVHSEDWEAAIAATRFISDDDVATLCDALGVIGTPEYCTERLAALQEAGVQNVYLMTLDTYNFPDDIVKAYGEHIIPALRQSGTSPAREAD